MPAWHGACLPIIVWSLRRRRELARAWRRRQRRRLPLADSGPYAVSAKPAGDGAMSVICSSTYASQGYRVQAWRCYKCMVSGGEDRRLDMDMAARRPARTRRRLRGSLWTGQRSFARRLNGTHGASHDDSRGWSEGGAWAPWMK
jgi:hypothetical protein